MGSLVGIVSVIDWEDIEILLDYWFPFASIDNALSDTIFDIVLGVIGGAAGAWVADHYLDRLFARQRTSVARSEVSE